MATRPVAAALDCTNKLQRSRKRYSDCSLVAAWLIGTAKVPYCETCAAKYPLMAGGRTILRERLATPIERNE
jgi:hypothetical protein